jgi:hypothetical protein
MPIDRGVLDNQLRSLGESSRWWNEREFRDLPAVLHADERVLSLSRGKLARVRWLRRAWLIVVTDQRLLCVRSARGPSWAQLEVGAALIERVTLRVGPFRGRVRVHAAGRTYRLLMPRPDAYRIATALSGLGTRANESISGFAPTLMVRRVIDHVLAMPAAALGPHAPRALPPYDPVVNERVATLESELGELRRQVDFLEQLLRERQLPPRQ